MRESISELAVAAALVLAGCELLPTGTPEAFSDCRGNIDSLPALPLDGTGSDRVEVVDDELLVTVSYSGGCAEHFFQICWPDRSFLESEPVQVGLELWHGSDPDGCDAYFTEVRAFDLAPLREAWHSAYSEGPGTIQIGLLGESVEYSFSD